MKVVNRKRLATLSLMMGMFFLPLGYDMIFYLMQKVVDSYVITTLFFYLVSLGLFGLYFSSSKEQIKTISLMMGTFFLPLGYDVAFYMIYGLVKSYLISTLFFYLISAIFFGLYIYLSEITLKVFAKHVFEKITSSVGKIMGK
jgi:hypothetical protein